MQRWVLKRIRHNLILFQCAYLVLLQFFYNIYFSFIFLLFQKSEVGYLKQGNFFPLLCYEGAIFYFRVREALSFVHKMWGLYLVRVRKHLVLFVKSGRLYSDVSVIQWSVIQRSVIWIPTVVNILNLSGFSKVSFSIFTILLIHIQNLYILNHKFGFLCHGQHCLSFQVLPQAGIQCF